jgi:universal stress protein E
MATKIRHILVAIRDLQHAPQKELRKAGCLARATGATVELFHAISLPDPGRGYPETKSRVMVDQEREAVTRSHERRLARLGQRRALRGVMVTCKATWDYPVHEAIIRRAVTTHADLVIAATHGHGLRERLLLRNTDWELVRHCPVPLLLVKSPRAYVKPVILAAIDPFHRHARPAGLDLKLLREGEQFARMLHGSLHVVHAYMPIGEMAPINGAPLLALPASVEEARSKAIAAVVARLAERANVPAKRRYVCMGEVSDTLSATYRRTGASILVMGAVSRSALGRTFIGSAAERVLDKVGCDMLIVKPRGFRSRFITSRLGTGGRGLKSLRQQAGQGRTSRRSEPAWALSVGY